jgi:hypothetical protein
MPIDALSIPILAGLVVVFLLYIGIAWTGRRKNRAITIPDDDEADPRPGDGL